MKMMRLKGVSIALSLLLAVQMLVVSCKDDPGADSYYTQSREYAADYLKNRDQYSEYLKILSRARGEHELRLVDMLGTYGSYTVFAPTNAAIEQYLMSKGLTSVDELTTQDCDTIALNSIIEMEYFTTDISEGEYPKSNMLERVVKLTCDTIWDEVNQDSILNLYVNNTAMIVHADDSVANGVVHTVNSVVGAPNDLIGSLILKDENCTVYADALKATGLLDTLQEHYVDTTYVWSSDQDRIDSCTWTKDAMCVHTAVEYDNVAYPQKRYFNYTVFICPDDVLRSKYGIESMEGLEAKAHEIYDPLYPDDANISDRTDRRNALNRFIAYHILDRYGTYTSLTCYDGDADKFKLQYCFDRDHYDICDWYETLMPYSMMKFSYPKGSAVGWKGNVKGGLWINRRGVGTHADERGVLIPGVRVYRDGYTNPNAGVNGIYHYVEDILAYDKTMQEDVMNDCIRMDATTLSPDFMTKLTDGETARGHQAGGNGQVYSLSSDRTATAGSNSSRCVAFKNGYVRNFKLRGNTSMHVRSRTLGYWSYEGDEMILQHRYDVEIKLPPVPAGTYEVRVMSCIGFESRGIVQCFLDGQAQGIPFDMRSSARTLFGWKKDSELGDQETITSFDKAIHNLGWMKGPKCYHFGEFSAFNSASDQMRDLESGGHNTIRRIIGTFTTDGKSDHYLRIQQKMESDNNEMNLDFIELCPRSVYNDEYYAESIY